MAAEGWFWRWGWGRRCPGRPGLPGPGPGPTTPLLLILLLGSVAADITDGNSEHLKREHSLIKPYQGVGSSSMPLWDFQGSTILTSQYVRLTPDERSKEGSIWNHQPCFLKDWEMHVHFKVHGAGKKNLHGDGIALWYTRDRLVHGPVFGSKDNFHGLAIFLDTYPNDETTERVFPYISVMVNNGSLSYDHSKDGRWTELAGCTADFRNRDHDTFLAVRYSRGRLTVMTDLEDKNEWKSCIDITGVRLPTGYYFGASAGTGDLSDFLHRLRAHLVSSSSCRLSFGSPRTQPMSRLRRLSLCLGGSELDPQTPGFCLPRSVTTDLLSISFTCPQLMTTSCHQDINDTSVLLVAQSKNLIVILDFPFVSHAPWPSISKPGFVSTVEQTTSRPSLIPWRIPATTVPHSDSCRSPQVIPTLGDHQPPSLSQGSAARAIP